MNNPSRSQSRSRRTLNIEKLEPRQLLAGDTYLVNFQNDEASIPTGYLADKGDIFGSRGGGLQYGWSTDHTDLARERSLVDDQRLDTLIHFENGQTWEFALPDGVYEVAAVVGDPDNDDGLHTLLVEGVSFFDMVQDGPTPLLHADQVTVADGRLTLSVGGAAYKATRIDYVHIVGLPSVPNNTPSTPVITEPAMDGQVVNPADVHMEAVGYVDADGHAHKSTDWEIWTVGDSPRPVWKTLGIQGVERLHTHLGDGFFMNDRAGQIDLDENTDYELRTRYRDETGEV